MSPSSKFLVLAVTAMVTVLFSCHQGADSGMPVYHFDSSQYDATVRPGDNFFRYTNGRWTDTVKIPATSSGVGSMFDVFRTTNDRLKTTLDSLSKSSNAPGSVEQKVGSLFAAGMDSGAIEKKGDDPVKPFFRQIDSIRDVRGVMDFVTAGQRRNENLLLTVAIAPDDKSSMVNLAVFSQGGLGLPDRDYYFKTDSPTRVVVKAYQDLLKNFFVLSGDDSVAAGQKMKKVFDLEKQMAASHKTNVELRDPNANYHKMAVAGLDRSMPQLAWKHSLEAMGIHVDSVNVQQPAYYTKVDQLLKTVPLADWKDYLRVHVLQDYANRLSSDFVNAMFHYSQKISGQQRLKHRAERMAAMVDASLGEALGEVYVKKYFPAADKQRMLDLVNNLQKAFAARIDKLDWMSDSTKKIAKEKLFAFIKKIGYPDKWRDYSKVKVDQNDYFGSRLSADINEYEYQLAKLYKPVDRTEWGLTPPTVNAYYNPSFNEIVFPAGILQPPFFDPSADDAVNYGAIGMVIGHEMTHGFDDQGSQYDKDGNLKNWWGKDDSTRFAAKTKAVIALYNGFTVLDTLHVNGALTNGENIADIGGLAVAYDAFKLTPEGHDSVKIDGYTPDQRFFLAFSRGWRYKIKNELLRTLINVDVHSPQEWRVNGPLMNFLPFYRAFNVRPGQKMYVADSARITIW